MNDRIKGAFDQVQAGDNLKGMIREFLVDKTGGYTKQRIFCPQRMIPYQSIVSAALCLLLLTFGGHWFYFTPTAKISIDVNPSLELGINRFDRVVAVVAYNEDGRELADCLDIRFMGYQEAVSRILENEKVTALLSQDEVMTITVLDSKGDQSVRILSDMESCVAGHQNAYCYSADSKEVAPAHGHGMSCGKYRAFLELQKLCPDITPEEIQNMTMREIRDLTDSWPEETGKHHHEETWAGERKLWDESKTSEAEETVAGEEKMQSGGTVEGEEKDQPGGIVEGEKKDQLGRTVGGEEKERSGGIVEGEEKTQSGGTVEGEEKEQSGGIIEGEEKEQSGGTMEGEEKDHSEEAVTGDENEPETWADEYGRHGHHGSSRGNGRRKRHD